MSVSPSLVTLTIAQTATLTATVNATNCTPVPGVTWSSGGAAVGIVPGATTAQITGVSVSAGPVAVTASAGGQSGASQVTVASAQTVVAFVGDNQIGLVGFALNVRPGVRLTGTGNTPVPNVSVTFVAATGGGSVTGATVTTNANGVAQVGSWILGASAGTNTLTATVASGGIGGNPVTFTATGAAAAFSIVIQNVGPAFTPAVQTAFNSAVAKWQQIIYQDIPDFPGFSANAGQCGAGSPAIGPITVDDVLILARIDSIDGPAGVLGSAGPCFIRVPGSLTIMGRMTFDSADVAALSASGSLNSVILHEMGHVLGFGTLWTHPQFDCLQDASTPPGTILDTHFSCPKGRAMFDSIGGTSYTGGNKVPVENCGPASPVGCGAGNVNGHWREPTFDDELMTPFIQPGVTSPLSRLSAAAMEDLGYGVNYAGSDNYVQIFTVSAAAPRAGLLSLGDDLYRGPIYVVDRSGRVVEVIQPR
ncbi:MAG: hypothetical protein ACREJ4_01990 [Candidatus Methylomirabilaceae bacterium]